MYLIFENQGQKLNASISTCTHTHTHQYPFNIIITIAIVNTSFSIFHFFNLVHLLLFGFNELRLLKHFFNLSANNPLVFNDIECESIAVISKIVPFSFRLTWSKNYEMTTRIFINLTFDLAFKCIAELFFSSSSFF